MRETPKRLTAELRFARVGSGARIAWAVNGHGPVLLRAAHWLTHVGQDPQSPIWRPWLEALGRRLTVVRYDERGFGSSSADGAVTSLESNVEELEAVVEACGADRVALLGISGAAPSAIAYAVRHPQRVSHLVVLGGFLAGTVARGASADTLAYFEARVQLMRLGWGRSNPAVQQFFTTTMLPEATPEQAAALNEQQRLSCDGERAAAMLRARAALDVRALAPRVACPTLVLHGEGDAMVALEEGRKLAAAIPGARFQTLPTRNHVPMAGEPAFERFCDAVWDFVAPVGARPLLTAREAELAALVAQGLDNLQISVRLGIAEKTVRNALSLLYAKLGVAGRAQAVARTRDIGL